MTRAIVRITEASWRHNYVRYTGSRYGTSAHKQWFPSARVGDYWEITGDLNEIYSTRKISSRSISGNIFQRIQRFFAEGLKK